MGGTMDDETLLRLFEQGAFPADQWGHREHVKVAYLLLRRYPLAESTDRMRSAPQAFATIHSVPNVLERGYHETITLVWMQLVHFTLCEYGPAESADHFYEQHPELSQSRASAVLLLARPADELGSEAEIRRSRHYATPQTEKSIEKISGDEWISQVALSGQLKLNAQLRNNWFAFHPILPRLSRGGCRGLKGRFPCVLRMVRSSSKFTQLDDLYKSSAGAASRNGRCFGKCRSLPVCQRRRRQGWPLAKGWFLFLYVRGGLL